jgi:hypothetical protein
MSPCDMSVLLIERLAKKNFGLAPRKWMAQLVEIRSLLECR